MGLGSDSVLKNTALTVLVMIALSAALYSVFQVIGYNSYLLGINIIALTLILLVVLFIWRVFKKMKEREVKRQKFLVAR